MNRSFSAIVYAAAIAAGAALFSVGPFGRQGGASPVAAAGQQAPAPAIVSAGGVTLRSVNLDFPDRDRRFAGLGPTSSTTTVSPFRRHGSDAATSVSGRVAGRGRENPDTYKTPVDAADVPAILNYLATLPR
jgi:hypothetical protein